MDRESRLRADVPLSLVLGAGGVRGMAHLGVLEVLLERGFRITEITGTSVGALILAFYAAVGMDVATLKSIGLSLTTRRLVGWGLLRRMPASIERRFRHRFGEIPRSLDLLEQASWDRLHHGVERIGIVAYDLERREEVICHSASPQVPLNDAARGAAAIPGVFPPRVCTLNGRVFRLSDGGVVNHLPVGILFNEPFQPAQVLAVDISRNDAQRECNRTGVQALVRAHRDVPIEIVCPKTLGESTIVYRSRRLAHLIETGRRAAEAWLAD